MKNLVRLTPLLALFTGACVSIGTMQTAHTVGDGAVQFAVEPAWEGVSSEGDSVRLPRLDFSVRHGLTDRIDIGGRIGASGLELTGKFQLTDPANRALVLALAPSVGGVAIGGASDDSSMAAGLLNISLPVLIGIGVGEKGSELVFGPKLIDTVIFGGMDGAGSAYSILSVGGSLGFCLSTGRFKLFPEVSIAKPVIGTVSSTDDSTISKMFKGGTIYQFGLGFLFGGR